MTILLSRAAIVSLAAIMPLAPLAARAADQAQGITLAKESSDQWRASKLVGVRVYGPDNKIIGKITDVLIGKDGRAQDVVIGVGGFLGIGEKDVAVPFAAVNFSDEPIARPTTGTPDNNNLAAEPAGVTPPGTMMANVPGTPAPAAGGLGAGTPAGLGAPADMNGAAAPVDTVARSGAYPDHAVIAFNADQLKSAPSFQFAR